MFIPTARERLVTEALLRHERQAISATELAGILQREWRALDGCLAKGFARRNEAGEVTLTDSGRKVL